MLLPSVALRGLLKSTYSSWLGVALPGYQCSVHLCENLFGVLDIDDCVSLYYTTHASCDIIKLVENSLAKKKMAVQVSIGQHNAPLCHMLATPAGTSPIIRRPLLQSWPVDALLLNSTLKKKWSGVLQ